MFGSLKRQVLFASLAGILFLLLVNVLAGWVMNPASSKINANQIVSPLDESQTPPILGASPVVARAQAVETKQQVQLTQPKVRHSYHRRHHWRHR
jgi:hypothetical protein